MKMWLLMRSIQCKKNQGDSTKNAFSGMGVWGGAMKCQNLCLDQDFKIFRTKKNGVDDGKLLSLEFVTFFSDNVSYHVVVRG